MKTIKIKTGDKIPKNYTGKAIFHGDNTTVYLKNGKLHRAGNEPAYISEGFKYWAINGDPVKKQHGTNNVCEYKFINNEWYYIEKKKQNIFYWNIVRPSEPLVPCYEYLPHRNFGPCESKYCNLCQGKSNKKCKSPGPAAIRTNGLIDYEINGKFHCATGPAWIDSNQNNELWYWHGKQLDGNKIKYLIDLDYPVEIAIKLNII